MPRVLIIIFLTGVWFTTQAQFSSERLALKRMDKGKWSGAEEVLRKSLRKDSINTAAGFIFSMYYSAPENPAFNLDSAYRYVLLATGDFSVSSPREKERLLKFPIDSEALVLQRMAIDSAAFEKAKKINTEKSYQDFISKYTFATERTVAIELRGELAFIETLKINTYKSFKEYLVRYPESARATEASQRYEKSFYADRTRDGKLKSFELFFRDFPGSPYNSEAEKNVFEISTASGKISSFINYLEKYPASRYKSRVNAILYHLYKEEEQSPVFVSDSLRKIERQERGYWVPVLKNGKFGFMDQYGVETVRPQFDSVHQDYPCGNIRTDYLSVAGGIINRAGKWIVHDAIADVQDLGSGFLKITKSECHYSVHKSGVSGVCHEDVKVIAHNFIAFKDRGRWGLSTLLDKVLIDPQYEDILALDTLIILVKNGKKILVTVNQIAAVANGSALSEALVYDDVRRLDKGHYLVRNGASEGVLNARLEFVIPLGRYSITKSSPGFILGQSNQFILAEVSAALDNKTFDQVQFYGDWIRLRQSSNLQLYNIKKRKIESERLDSLRFDNELAFAFRHDTLKVYLNSGIAINFQRDTKVNFIESVDSSRYFLIPEKVKKTIYNAASGKKLFSFEADKFEFIGNGAFLVSKGNKKGLISQEGKTLVPLEYAAIVQAGRPWVSLLKDKKFGMYNLTTHKLVKPLYDRNIAPFSARWLIAYRDGGYGFIGLDSKPHSKFEFEEVKVWNDTAAWVKKNFQWMIYGVSSGKIVLSNVKDYHYVQESPLERIAIVRRDLFYGVVSNRRGELIPANFSDIVNVGSVEDPIYFSEKNVEEAGIHVVIYYDENGKLLRKQAYEDDEYERIYCDEN
jgi:hypothetical protein